MLKLIDELRWEGISGGRVVGVAKQSELKKQNKKDDCGSTTICMVAKRGQQDASQSGGLLQET